MKLQKELNIDRSSLHGIDYILILRASQFPYHISQRKDSAKDQFSIIFSTKDLGL